MINATLSSVSRLPISSVAPVSDSSEAPVLVAREGGQRRKINRAAGALSLEEYRAAVDLRQLVHVDRRAAVRMDVNPVAVRPAVERRQVREVDLRAAVARLNARRESARAGITRDRRQVEYAGRIGVKTIGRESRQAAERGRGAVVRREAAVGDARDLSERGGCRRWSRPPCRATSGRRYPGSRCVRFQARRWYWLP